MVIAFQTSVPQTASLLRTHYFGWKTNMTTWTYPRSGYIYLIHCVIVPHQAGAISVSLEWCVLLNVAQIQNSPWPSSLFIHRKHVLMRYLANENWTLGVSKTLKQVWASSKVWSLIWKNSFTIYPLHCNGVSWKPTWLVQPQPHLLFTTKARAGNHEAGSRKGWEALG